MAPWPVRVAKALDRDENSRVIVENLDQIIRWITGRPADSTTALDQEIEKLGLEPAMARTRALIIINRMMLSRQDPWQALGVRRGTNVDEVRVRYKRLMQVFHPDRGFADSDWLSDCTARLHWAHDAIRKSPSARGGFSAGFGKRQHRPSPPPRTRKPAEPIFRKPESAADGGSHVAGRDRDRDSGSPTQTHGPRRPAAAPQPAGIASGVWQFPTADNGSTTPHQQDEQYVQKQARRTTESVATPEESEFAKTHDVMAEDLQSDIAVDHEDDPAYNSVFERALDEDGYTDQSGAGSSPHDQEFDEESSVADRDAGDADTEFDIFEQASPSSTDLLQPSVRIRVDKPSISLQDPPNQSNASDVQSTGPQVRRQDEDVTEDGDALDRLVEQRIERSKVEQARKDMAQAAAIQAKREAEENQKLAEQEIARLKQLAKEKKARERLARQEEHRKEKEQRKLLRREQRLERTRVKEQQKQEKISRKHRELQQQKLEAEASEKRLREERQRKRAQAKERAEAEAEKRRLKELNELHQQEVEAMSAQRAREAERRRRHLEAEGNRLSSVSERTYSDLESLTETTIPPWHERSREPTTDVAHAHSGLESPTAPARSPKIRARSTSSLEESESEVTVTSRAAVSNVEPISAASAKLRDKRREDTVAEPVSKPKVESIRRADKRGDADTKHRRRTATAPPITEPPTQQAANDDTATRPGKLLQPRLVVAAIGGLALLLLTVVIGKLFFAADEADLANGESAGHTDTVVTAEPEARTTDVTDTSGTVESAVATVNAPADDQVASEATKASTDSSAGDAIVADGEQTEVPVDGALPGGATPSTDESSAVSESAGEGRTTVRSIQEPAIDRNPTTVSTIAGSDSGQASSTVVSQTDSAQASERGVNVSSDPLENVRYIAEEFRRRFIEGDTEGFASLFADDARMNELRGAAEIRDTHGELFGSTSRRHVSIDLGQINGNGEYYSTRGRLSQVLRYSDGTSRLSDSNFDMTVVRDGDNFVIRSLLF